MNFVGKAFRALGSDFVNDGILTGAIIIFLILFCLLHFNLFGDKGQKTTEKENKTVSKNNNEKCHEAREFLAILSVVLFLGMVVCTFFSSININPANKKDYEIIRFEDNSKVKGSNTYKVLVGEYQRHAILMDADYIKDKDKLTLKKCSYQLKSLNDLRLTSIEFTIVTSK